MNKEIFLVEHRVLDEGEYVACTSKEMGEEIAKVEYCFYLIQNLSKRCAAKNKEAVFILSSQNDNFARAVSELFGTLPKRNNRICPIEINVSDEEFGMLLSMDIDFHLSDREEYILFLDDNEYISAMHLLNRKID